MILKMAAIAIILLATFMPADLARIQSRIGEQRLTENEQEDATDAVIEDKALQEANGAADRTEAESAGARVTALNYPATLAQEAALHGLGLSAAFDCTVRTRSGVVSDDPFCKKRKVHSARNASSSFSKTLDYVNSIQGGPYQQEAVLKAACDSMAFSCEEIIQFTKALRVDARIGHDLVVGVGSTGAIKLFAEARNNKGCISDPANAKSILVSLQAEVNGFHDLSYEMFGLQQAFVNNENLEPAKDIAPPPMRIHTGLRTDKDMKKLLADMAELQLIKAYAQGSENLGENQKSHFIKGHSVAGGAYYPGSPAVEAFESWLKDMRANGAQFSGPQLISLVDAIPAVPLPGRYFEPGQWKGDGRPDFRTLQTLFPETRSVRNSGTAQAVSVLLRYLEQYVTGVTCEEVKLIIQRLVRARKAFFVEGLDALKSNILDDQNKVDIVAFTDSIGGYIQTTQTERVLRGVGLGLPPRNNPIFGLVKGNPAIFVVDESTSMDAMFTLGDDALTRRNFCNRQLEIVLGGLPNGTYFNVVQYSGSASKIFERPVLANRSNIVAAMEAMGTTWRGDFNSTQDPMEMLRNVKIFALKLKDRLNQSAKKKSVEALQLAYATADLPSQQADDGQHTLPVHRAPQSRPAFYSFTSQFVSQWRPQPLMPQIYFLTSGQPDGGASQVLVKIDEFDNGRRIPVNSIAFMSPADVMGKKFAKDLAHKTGGFFRSIEPLNSHTNKRKREKTEQDVRSQTQR